MAKLKVWLILILLWVIIGSTYITIKIAIDTIPTFLMSGIRYESSGGPSPDIRHASFTKQ